MTKKDYELVARVLKASRPARVLKYSVSSQRALHNWEATVRRMASALWADSHRFDETRFLEACGLK